MNADVLVLLFPAITPTTHLRNKRTHVRQRSTNIGIYLR
jgi:hypothetical protein